MSTKESSGENPKTSKKKTPWPRRRELDLERITDILERNLELIVNVPKDALAKHGLDRDVLEFSFREIRKSVLSVKVLFAQLPDKFPPRGTRAIKARAAFVVGAKVRLRENRIAEYEGIFGEYVTDEFTIVGELRKNFLPISHPAFGEDKFYPSKAHVEIVPTAEDE